MIATLAACGGTSTDTGNPFNTASSQTNSDSNSNTNTDDDSNAGGGTNPTPTPVPGDPNPYAVISATPTSGVATLQVTVNANQSFDDQGITNYTWNFGDGNVSSSPVTTHSYTQAGTYTLSLTVTDAQGRMNTASTAIHVFGAVDNSSAIVPSGVTFYDSFEYAVDRANSADPSGHDNPFTNQGGWSGVKAVNVTGSHNGFLYTVNQIPGYAGTFPGRNSNSVLAIESRPGSMGSQTDFYLEYGSVGSPRGTVPANVWFQYWIYPNRYDDPTDQNDQLSEFEGRFKFIYPCNTSYPCQDGQLNWLHMLGYHTSEPYWANQDRRELFMTTVDPFASAINYQAAPIENSFKLGQTDVSENLTPNRWTLVKIHYDTSTSSGTYEAWMKPMGGDWVKVAEWINGQTPDFEWVLPANMVGGHRVFRMPTTINYYDSWIYLDDFAMATSEADLPVYPY